MINFNLRDMVRVEDTDLTCRKKYTWATEVFEKDEGAPRAQTH